VVVTHGVTGAPVWSSGPTATNATSLPYPPTAPSLNASTPYRWTVAVTGVAAAGSAADVAGGFNVSAPTAFVTAGAAALTTSAQPIWHGNGSAGFTYHLLQTRVPARAAAIVGAYAFATANPQPSTQGETENAKLLAAYRLYLNGALVGMGPGRPGRCGPVCPIQKDPLPCPCTPEQVYDGYNVTDAVVAGQPLSVALQCFNYPPTGNGVLNQTSKVLAVVVVWYGDGSVVHIGTGAAGPDGSTWVSHNADAYFNPSCCVSDVAWYLQPAENVVTALELVGWRQAGYTPSPGDWTPSAPQLPFSAALVARPGEPVTVTEGVPAASVVAVSPGHWFIDFGREFQVGVRVCTHACMHDGL
jgi:hypothetical protein